MKKNIIIFWFSIFFAHHTFAQFVSTFAGSGVAGFINGTGTGAKFFYPSQICIDPTGNIFVADQYNNMIRKITPLGVVSTLAGSGASGAADGTGASASFNQPFGICSDAGGNIYVGENGNHKIRKITPAGVVTTLAGSGTAGFANGTGAGASFNYPNGVCADAAGNIFVSDFFNNRIRKVTQAGVVTTFAGSGAGGATDATGLAATFSGPVGLCIDINGDLFVTEYFNSKIRKITPSAVVTTFAGSGTANSIDGTGTAASLFNPVAICVDATGDFYVAEQNGQKIRKISSGAVVTTFAGSGQGGNSDGPNLTASFDYPEGICADNLGNIFVSDLLNNKIRRIGSCSPPDAPIGATGLNEVCAGNSATLSAGSTGTVTWYLNATGGSAISSGTNFIVSNTLSPGTYTYYAEAFTCTVSPTRTAFVFTVNPLPNVTVNSGSICVGQSFTMVPGGALTYSYSSTTAIVSPSVNASYSVTGVDGSGCLNSAVSNITVNALPIITVNSGSICAGQSFTMVPNGSASYTYSSGSPIVSPLVSSIFTVSSNNAAGCIGTIISTVTVNTPTIVVNNGAICIGQSFTMFPTGATTYTFSSGSPIVTPSANISYTIDGTNPFGCVGSSISNVTVNPLPNITANSGTICYGQSFTISPAGAVNYTFSSGSPIISPTVSTTYSIIGMDALGCLGNSISNVTVNPLPLVTANNGTVCLGQPFTIIPGGAVSYTYSTGSTTINPTSNTIYTVSGTSVFGCVNTTTQSVIVNPLPVLYINYVTNLICQGSSMGMNVTGAQTYTWSNGNIANSIVLTPTVTTTYTVSGTDSLGCINSAAVIIVVSLCTDLKQYLSSNNISIYPNPNNGQFYISEFENNIGKNIEIYNSVGQLIKQIKIESAVQQINIHEFSNGFYFIRIKEENTILNISKIVKQ